MRYLYDAKLVPIGQPVNIPDEHGRPGFYTFDEKSFELERTRPGNVNVCLKHDRSKRIGKLTNLIPHGSWWICDFVIDPALRSELSVGQPVSVGLVSLSFGSGVPILSEVSIVTRGAVDGACITRRHELKPVPSQRTEQPKPRAIAAAVPASTAVYRTTRKRQVDHHAELQRRIDFAEANGHHVDVEMIIVNMQAELGRGGIDRAWADHLRRRAA